MKRRVDLAAATRPPPFVMFIIVTLAIELTLPFVLRDGDPPLPRCGSDLIATNEQRGALRFAPS
jgi:hypothetical protein